MSRFLRPSLGEGFGYTPGEQPGDGETWVKLNTNESSLPPSPRVAPAVAAAAATLNRYPHPRAEPLRSALAAYHGVRPEQVSLGNGADAVIDACFLAFCEPGSTVVLTEPTYSLLPVAARIHDVEVVTVPAGDDGSISKAFATTPAPLRFLVNPNSPTGRWVEPQALARDLAASEGVTVIDEAYGDFAPSSCVPLLAGNPRWLVVRTFSKAHALAGLRVGYALGSPELIADLDAVAESYPVDRCAVAGAAAALGDEDHHRGLVAHVLAERSRLRAELEERGWEVIPSHANFLCTLPPSGTAAEAARRLRRQRVLVRHFDDGGRGLLRVTIGTAAETDALLAALDSGR